MRRSKTVAGDTTQYVLDLATTLPVVISDTDAIYLYGLDIIAEQLALRQGSGQAHRYYYVHDGLGSVRHPSTRLRAGLVDNTGQIAETYAYDPFGVPLAGGSVPNPYRFTGEAWDAEVELLHLRARYYQPATGRFMTKDPWPGDLQRPGTLNPYSYVTNSPVNLRDPSGLNGPGPLFPELQEPATDTRSQGIPPLVSYIHGQMVGNAQGPIVMWIWLLNQASASRNHIADWPSWTPVLGQLQKAPGIEDISSKALALGAFGYMVRQDGPWDPKPHIRTRFPEYFFHQVGEHWYYYDIWGNIMFGYLGAAAGFSESELMNGAGLEQIGSDIGYTVRQENPCRLPRPRPIFHFLRLRAWDHPEDRVTAMMGIRLWRAFNINVTSYHIMQAVGEAGDKNGIQRWEEPPP